MVATRLGTLEQQIAEAGKATDASNVLPWQRRLAWPLRLMNCLFSFSVAQWVSPAVILHVFDGGDGPGELPCGNNFSVSYWEMVQLADVLRVTNDEQ